MFYRIEKTDGDLWLPVDGYRSYDLEFLEQCLHLMVKAGTNPDILRIWDEELCERVDV